MYCLASISPESRQSVAGPGQFNYRSADCFSMAAATIPAVEPDQYLCLGQFRSLGPASNGSRGHNWIGAMVVPFVLISTVAMYVLVTTKVILVVFTT